MQRSLTMLNETGDTTIVWDEDQDDAMEAIIAKKMAAGMSFFIVEPRFFGLMPPKRTPLKHPDEARKHRALSIKDEDLSRFVSDGAGDVAPTPPGEVKTVRRAKTAKEAASAQTVGVKPLKGG